MAEFADGENNFSDDDLDYLPANALQELENNAIQFTQAATQAARLKAPLSSDYGDEFDDFDLDDAVVIDEAKSTPAVNPILHRGPQSQVAQREHSRPQRYEGPSYPAPNLVNKPLPLPNERPTLEQPNRNRPPVQVHIRQHESMVAEQGSQPESGDKVDDLQKQIQEGGALMKERDALRSDLNAKTGEIAIVRSKQDKAAKEHEREMAMVRKLNEEKMAKQLRALEAAKIAQQQAAVEREFLKQDLSEEAERVRRLKAREAAEKKESAGLATPRKKKSLAHRDGFDDDEIQILSPSKISPLKFQKNPGTPTKAGKRKRKAVDSPVAPLDIIHPEDSFPQEPEQRAPVLDETILARLGIQDDRFDFVGTMLDHRPTGAHLRTIQELGKHALPSTPNESFQSIILGSLPALGLKRPVSDLPIEFCELLITLWSKCMDEKEPYYKAIYLFVDMLTLALELKTSFIAPHIMDTLVPLIQITIEKVAIPRFKNRKPPEDEEKAIDSPTCLVLLHLEALGCMSEEQHITRFWKLMRWDFTTVMLSNNHTPRDYEITLSILSTGVLRDSFGPITENHYFPWMEHIIDRLTYPFYEIPPKPLSPEKIDLAQLRKLQLQILHLMTGMTRSPYSSLALATHPHAIARLVTLMSDAFDALYDYKSSHEDSARILTMSLRLLYHLITTHDKTIKVPEKLAVIQGGIQKYQLCLARLNFFDDGVLEAGIGADVPRLAFELIEGVVTMEEADAIHEAFPSI